MKAAAGSTIVRTERLKWDLAAIPPLLLLLLICIIARRSLQEVGCGGWNIKYCHRRKKKRAETSNNSLKRIRSHFPYAISMFHICCDKIDEMSIFERGVGARHPQTGFRRHQPKLDKKACGEEWKSHTERTESPVFASAGQQLHHHVYYNSYLHFLNPKEEEGSSSSQRQQQQQDQTWLEISEILKPFCGILKNVGIFGIWKWPNSGKNSQINHEIPKKNKNCDSLSINTSPSSFFFLPLFCPFSVLKEERKKCTWALKNSKISKNWPKF